MLSYLSFPDYFILIPFLTVLVLLIQKNKEHKIFQTAFISSFITFGVVFLSLFYNDNFYDSKNSSVFVWIQNLGSNLTLIADGISKILCLLTSIVYIFVVYNSKTKTLPNLKNYFILLFLMQIGLMGVFLSYDGLVFYFFWELVLIPAYFLAIKWGTDKSLKSTYKFYIYTFLGSIFMLVGLIYLYTQSPEGSFRLESLIQSVTLTVPQQRFVFVCFFLRFCYKNAFSSISYMAT